MCCFVFIYLAAYVHVKNGDDDPILSSLKKYLIRWLAYCWIDWNTFSFSISSVKIMKLKKTGGLRRAPCDMSCSCILIKIMFIKLMSSNRHNIKHKFCKNLCYHLCKTKRNNYLTHRIPYRSTFFSVQIQCFRARF